MGQPTTRVADVRLNALERFPWRRAILVVLAVAITAVVVIGSVKTLSLTPAEGGLPANDWVRLIVQGVSQGAIFALIALGYTMVYGILRMINFAHGEVFMAGAFCSMFFAQAFAESGFMNSNTVIAMIILFAVAIAASTGIAVLLERVAYRPVRSAPRLVPLITAIGASLFIQNAFRGFFGPQPYAYPQPGPLVGTVTILGITMQKIEVLTILVAIAAMVTLQLLVSRTRTGRSMRAVAEDREIASLMGIDVKRTIVITFVIGAVLAGVAAVLYSLTFQQVQFTMGFKPGIVAFTAAVLGGIGSIGGSVLGGFTIGVLRAVGPALLLTGFGVPSPYSLTDAFVFLVLVLVLVYRPGGLLGHGEAEKV